MANDFEQEQQPIEKRPVISLLNEDAKLIEDKGNFRIATRHIEGIGDLNISLESKAGLTGYKDDTQVWVLNDGGLELAINPKELLKQGFKTLSMIISSPETDVVDAKLKHVSSRRPFLAIFQPTESGSELTPLSYWMLDDDKSEFRDIMLPPDENLLRKTKLELTPLPI